MAGVTAAGVVAPLRCPRGAKTVNPRRALERVGASWSRLCAKTRLVPKSERPRKTPSWKNDLRLPKTVTASDQVTWMRGDLQTLFTSKFGEFGGKNRVE